MPQYRLSIGVVEQDENGTERYMGAFETQWRDTQTQEIMFYSQSGETKEILFYDNVFPPSPSTTSLTTEKPIQRYGLQAAGLNPNPTIKDAGQYIDVLTNTLTAVAVWDVMDNTGNITFASNPPKLTVYTAPPAPTLTGRRVRVEGDKTFTSGWVNVGTAGYLKLHILPDAPYNSAAVSVGPSNASGDLPEEDSDKEIFEYNVPLQVFGLTQGSYLLTTERGSAYAYVSLSDVAMQPIVDQLYSDGSVVAGTGLKTYLVQGTGTKLETPEITVGSHYNWVVSWPAVTHAKYYNVYVNGVLKATQEATTAEVKTFGYGKYTVQALPDNDDQLYTASDISEPFEIFGPYIRAYTGVPFLPSDNDVLIFENQDARDAFLDQYKVLDAPKIQTFYQHQARINLSCPNNDEYKDLRLCNYLAVYDGRRIFYYFITAVAEIELPAEDQPSAEQWPASFVADIVPDNWQTYAQRFDPDSNTYISAMSVKNAKIIRGKFTNGYLPDYRTIQTKPEGATGQEVITYRRKNFPEPTPPTLSPGFAIIGFYIATLTNNKGEKTNFIQPFVIPGLTATDDDDAAQKISFWTGYLSNIDSMEMFVVSQGAGPAVLFQGAGSIANLYACPSEWTPDYDTENQISISVNGEIVQNSGIYPVTKTAPAYLIMNAGPVPDFEKVYTVGTPFTRVPYPSDGTASYVYYEAFFSEYSMTIIMNVNGQKTDVTRDFQLGFFKNDQNSYFERKDSETGLAEISKVISGISGALQVVAGVAAFTNPATAIAGSITIAGGVNRVVDAAEKISRDIKENDATIAADACGAATIAYGGALAVYEYTPKNAAQIHNEIVQYGYVYNDAFLQSVDLTNGTDFVFVQVSDCEIVMTAPAVIVAEMKSRIMGGLRVWNNPDNFLNYGTE